MQVFPTDQDIGYVAGFLDGEGSIFVFEITGKMQVRVNIYQDSVDVLKYIQKLYGGSLFTGAGRNKTLGLAKQEEVQRLLEDVLPWLRVKEKQAIIGLIILMYKQQWYRAHMPVDVKQHCQLLALELSDMQSYSRSKEIEPT